MSYVEATKASIAQAWAQTREFYRSRDTLPGGANREHRELHSLMAQKAVVVAAALAPRKHAGEHSAFDILPTERKREEVEFLAAAHRELQAAKVAVQKYEQAFLDRAAELDAKGVSPAALDLGGLASPEAILGEQ